MYYCTMVCDLQFGSTGKGLIAGYLAERDKPDTVITAWMPNAGHTYINSDGDVFIHTMLANGVVSPKLKRIMLAPGSAINFDNLIKEIKAVGKYMEGVELIIHENAAVVLERHRVEESKSMVGIGSTKKGCGAALAEKLKRQVHDNNSVKSFFKNMSYESDQVMKSLMDLCNGGVHIVNTGGWLVCLDRSDRVQIEGAQGFSLGVNSGFYPYVTSRECTPSQIASDCLISLRDVDKIVGCMRTYPIRVANRFDDQGNQIGYSGPGYFDQAEITWDSIGQTPELTTVTKLQRRIFNFSSEQTRQALQICRPDEIFLNFVNYLSSGEITDMVCEINSINEDFGNNPHIVRYLGHGAKSCNVQDMQGV